ECLSDETKTKSTKVSLHNNDDNDDYDNNDRDLSHLSILEEAVTTV
ncbi:unnamed protein product, partial [Rotaria magnacalcarata]